LGGQSILRKGKMNNTKLYHCFPRRKRDGNEIDKGLSILKSILTHGILLTPEIIKWTEEIHNNNLTNEFVQVSKRVCFTELEEEDLNNHFNLFGNFALAFDIGDLINIGALPVFYIPRMDAFKNYGLGPALITQLAHIQSLLKRIALYENYASRIAEVTPNSHLMARYTENGDMHIFSAGTIESIRIPKSILENCAKHNKDFIPPRLNEFGSPLGFSIGGLNNFLKILFYDIHNSSVLNNVLGGFSSIIYPTERQKDRFLEYYKQREWRILGGVEQYSKRITQDLNENHKFDLLKIDKDFF
jgi:hypothetical protein